MLPLRHEAMVKTIIISNEVTLNQGVSPTEGAPIYSQIVENISKGEQIVLDFANMSLTTTAFLNVVIGMLYKDYTSEQLKKYLSFDNLTDEIAIRIKQVTDNAKLFYKRNG